MTQPEPASEAHHVPPLATSAQPPVPLAPPGATLSDPPAAFYAPEPAAVTASAASLDPAPLLPRVFASAVDFVLTFVVTVVVAAFLLYVAVIMGFSGADGAYGVLVLAFAACVVIPLAANALKVRQVRSGRQTVGKRMMRIAIVDARTGGTVTIRQAIIRAAIVVVPSLVTVGAINLAWDFFVGQSNPYGIGLSLLSPIGFVAPIVWIAALIMMSVGDRRGLWERAAGTRVVTAQSLWWAANGVPNPRLVPEAGVSGDRRTSDA
jgi:uncharacterized RDD family membrane protein YckC